MQKQSLAPNMEPNSTAQSSAEGSGARSQKLDRGAGTWYSVLGTRYSVLGTQDMGRTRMVNTGSQGSSGNRFS